MNILFFLKNRLKQVLVLSLIFVCQIPLAQNNDTYKLLWKIEGNDIKAPSYLFGTMHVEDARAFNFSDAVMPSIESCEKFALEINADSAFVAYRNKIVTKDPVIEFKSILNDEEYKKLVDRFIEVNGYSFEDSELKDINTILVLLFKEPERPDDKVTFVDMHLLGQAKTMGKTIIGLESVDSQINHYENLKQEDKKAYIMNNLEYTKSDSDKLIEDLKKIYYTGDILEIERITNNYGQNEDEEMISRNKVISSSIDKTIRTSTLFSAIGAAHLPGKYGVINLLKEKGYSVTPVKAEFTGVAESYKIDLSNGEWYTFKDEQVGYSVMLPQAPNSAENFKDLTINSYTSMLDGSVYMMFGMDLRHYTNDVSFKTLANGYISNLTKSDESKILEEKEYTKDGIEYLENIIKMGDGTFLSAKLAFKGKILYFISKQTKTNDSEKNSLNRFFNSLQFSSPKKEIKKIENNSKWETHTYKKGAFSIDLPRTPKDLSRETPDPLNPEGEKYFLNIYNIMDIKNEDNYLFRYNDVPSGYFMENPADGFLAMQQNLTASGTLVTDAKVISLDGYEGREYEVLLQDKYHAICRVYFRGNRTYVILQQKLNETDKVNPDNTFFNSFKFNDYEPKKLNTRTIKNTSIEIKEFDNNKIEIDTLDFDNSYLKNTYTYYSTNPNSGDVYLFSYGDFKNYFTIKNLNEFYDTNFDFLKNWNDTIMSRKDIKINNVDGAEALIKNKTTNVEALHRIWIEDNKLLFYTAYTSNNSYSKSMTDSIFNGYKFKGTSNSDLDLYSSKTDLIFKDLKSKDSLTKLRALRAFEYYEFDETDLSTLHQNLKTNYGNDSINEDIRFKIIREFQDINNAETLNNLEALYLNNTSSDLLKIELLTTIQSLGTDNSLESFINLLLNHSPKDLSNNSWLIFKPFRDSLSLTFSNYDKLIKLTDTEGYRQPVLSLSNDILEEKKDSLKIISTKFDALLKYSKEDLKNYLILVKDTLNYDYTYNSRIYQYLRLMHQPTVNTKAVDEFTSQLITREDNTWFQQNAVIARIAHQLPIEKKLINSLIDSTNSRFRIMKALYESGQSKKIPKTYLKQESFAKLSLIDYLEDDDYYDYDITILGDYKHNNNKYLGAKISYSYEGNDEHYFALVGPIYDLASKNELNLYDIKLDWNEFEDDWSALAKTLLLETEVKD